MMVERDASVFQLQWRRRCSVLLDLTEVTVRRKAAEISSFKDTVDWQL